jgi:hypothetical protein
MQHVAILVVGTVGKLLLMLALPSRNYDDGEYASGTSFAWVVARSSPLKILL